MSKCGYKGCDLDCWKDFDTCILHCPKGIGNDVYQKDRKNGTLREFYKKFKEYVIDELATDGYSGDENIDQQIVTGEIDVDNLERADLSQSFIAIQFIVFPTRDSRDTFDYFKILNLFGEICFDSCEFITTYLSLSRIKVLFANCIFHDCWSLYDYRLFDSIAYVIYDTCHFKKEVSPYRDGDRKISHPQFNYSCKFDDELILYNIAIEKSLFHNVENRFDLIHIKSIVFDKCVVNESIFLNSLQMEKFEIYNTIVNGKIYINKQDDNNQKVAKIKELIIYNTTFRENFKLHNCEVENLVVKSSDFEKHADFYKSKFEEGLIYDKNNKDKTIYFKALNFKGLALFGDCIFDEKVSFRHVTFEGHCHFREAIFNNGLDLDYTNIEKEMNFFGIKGLDNKQSKKNTSQETYRIIKHNLQKIGNQIESNKYHALELDQKRLHHECKSFSDWQDILVFYIHWITSKYATNWMLPILWMFIVALIVSIFTKYSIDELVSSFNFKNIWDIFHIKFISLFAKIDIDDHPVLFLFHKISLGYLYYQFVSAVRKNVKR